MIIVPVIYRYCCCCSSSNSYGKYCCCCCYCLLNLIFTLIMHPFMPVREAVSDLKWFCFFYTNIFIFIFGIRYEDYCVSCWCCRVRLINLNSTVRSTHVWKMYLSLCRMTNCSNIFYFAKYSNNKLCQPLLNYFWNMLCFYRC